MIMQEKWAVKLTLRFEDHDCKVTLAIHMMGNSVYSLGENVSTVCKGSVKRLVNDLCENNAELTDQ